MKLFFHYSLRILLFVSGIAGAQNPAILVDFGSSGLKAVSPDSNARYWNHVTDANPSGLSNLISESGQPLGITLTTTGYEGVNNRGTTVPNSSILGVLANANACADSFFVTGDNIITITLGNIPLEGVLRLSLFGSCDAEEIRTSCYDVAGSVSVRKILTTSGLGIGVAPQVNANRSSISTIDNISPSSSGTLTIQVSPNSHTYGYIGALRLEFLNTVNFSPMASEIVLNGAPRVGTLIKCQYTYTDRESDAEATPAFVWERSLATGNVGTVVTDSDAPLGSYRIKDSDEGYYYRCAVIPVANTGNAIGQKTYSPWYGPIRSSSTLTSFHIGNSFTRWINIPRQLSSFSAQELRPLFAGFQLTDGQSLNYHWNSGVKGGWNITDGLRSREELATSSWDILILQPHSQEWMNWAIADFTDHARRFSQLADAKGTQVYLYAYWPWLSVAMENQSVINSMFEQVRSTISEGANKSVLIIPAGEAIRACVQACGSGALTGYTRNSFYADERHPSALGGYVSALTHYATIYKKSPEGLPAQALSPYAENQIVNIPPAVALRLQQIVWEVVRVYPQSGVDNPPPPPVVEPDPPFVSESTTPPDPQLLSYAFGNGAAGASPIMANLPRPVASNDAGMVSFAYTINTRAENEGVLFTPHWSYDLRRWTTTQPVNTVITRTDNTVKISWPKTSRWRFLRVHLFKP